MANRTIPVNNRLHQVDGRTVARSVIPDSAIAHYDISALSGYSDGDAVTSIPDQLGNYDLTADTGNAEYIANWQNGEPALYFDGSVSFSNSTPSISQPNTYYVVYDDNDDTGSSRVLAGTVGADPDRQFVGWENPGLGLYAGSTLSPTTTTRSAHLDTATFDGANSSLRVNQDEVTGDAGSNGQEGVRLGASSDGRDILSNGHIAEVMVCNDRDIAPIFESSLIDKYDL